MSPHVPPARSTVAASSRPFERVSLSRQFLLASGLALLAGMLTVGMWLGDQIERTAVNRAAGIASVYVESILAEQLQGWHGQATERGRLRAAFDRIFVDGPLRRKVVRFKLWGEGGLILYSSDHAQDGRTFPMTERLSAAFGGVVQARLSDLEQADNLPERERWSQLLEVYVPIRTADGAAVSAVAEFYHSTENLGRDIREARERTWLLVVVSTVAIFLLLLVWVRRADHTIVDQQKDLRLQLEHLRATLDDNDRMRRQLREAGAHTTALNERLLHRIAADIHDGPAQTIAFAAMRFDELGRACEHCRSGCGDAARDFPMIRSALGSSLEDLRGIASGLGMPDIGSASLPDIALRAVRDFEQRSAKKVRAVVGDGIGDASPAVKITVYRLLQEALANSHRHAPDSIAQVSVDGDRDEARIEVSDTGSGFDPQAAASSGRLGLAFMHQRVRLLGGVFEIDSAPGHGTSVRARLPLRDEAIAHA